MDPEVQDSDKPASSVPPTVAPGAVPLRPYTPRPVPRSVPASLVPARKWSRPEAVLRCAGRYSPELPEGADWCELQELRRARGATGTGTAGPGPPFAPGVLAARVIR